MREEGYYWVKLMGKWIIAKWLKIASDYGYWELSMSEQETPVALWDHSFDEIRENRLIHPSDIKPVHIDTNELITRYP